MNKNYIKKNMVVQSNVEPFSVSVSDNTVICYNGARLLSGEKYNESGTVLYTEEESAFDIGVFNMIPVIIVQDTSMTVVMS